MDLRGFGLSDDDLRQLGYDVAPKAGEHGPRQGSGAPTPPAARRPWQPATRRWLATVLVISSTVWASSAWRGLPREVVVTAPDSAFSSGRALVQLVEIAQQPRPTGSPENERVRGYLLRRLASLGLEPELQETTAFSRDSTSVRAASLRNVVARVPGSAQTGAIVLAAHYDSAPLSPGAGDDGIGVATVLEAVRALLAGPPLRNDVIVLFTDADDLGRLGSGAFVGRHPWASDVAATLTVEARGVAGPAMVFETGLSRPLVTALSDVSPPRAISLARSLRSRVEPAPNPLLASGPGLTVSVLGDAAMQHQPRDTRERISERTLQHAGGQLLAVARSLGGIDFSQLDETERVYLSLPGWGLVHYPRAWVLPTAAALAVLWMLAGLVLRGRRATRIGTGIGLVYGAGVVVLGALLARGLRDFAAPMHPEYGALTTAFYEDGVYQWAAAALSIACAAIAYALVKRWARRDELIFGALSVPLLSSLWVAVQVPDAAPALQLPLAAALLAGVVVIVAGPNRSRSVWAWGALALLTGVALALAVPAVELVSATWTFGEATALGAVLGLTTLLLLPLMDPLLVPRWWVTPTLVLVAAAVLVGLSTPAMRAPDAHPLPTTLVYLADAPVGGSLPAPRPPGMASDSSRVRSMAGRWLTVPGPGEEWARSWAGEPATGDTDPGVLLIGADERFEIVGTAPVTELAAPRASVVSSSVVGPTRTVEVLVEPGLVGEMTGLYLPPGSPGALIGVGDARWTSGSTPVRALTHWGAPIGSGLVVTLEVDTVQPEISLVVLEHHLRPRLVVGGYFFQRPDSMTPNASVGSDRAIQRTTIRVPIG